MQRIFPLASVSRPALGPTQPPIQWVPGEADHSLPSSAEVKNEKELSPPPRAPKRLLTCSGTALLSFIFMFVFLILTVHFRNLLTCIYYTYIHSTEPAS
jgi:hypothetical protein